MPVTLAQLTTNKASVVVTIDAETSVTVEYYPGYVTEKIFAQIQGFASANESDIVSQFTGFNEALARLIASWDVLNDDGTMFPVEVSRLAELPIAFRMEVLNAIIGDINPQLIASQDTA